MSVVLRAHPIGLFVGCIVKIAAIVCAFCVAVAIDFRVVIIFETIISQIQGSDVR
jgi:hypothetical protein